MASRHTSGTVYLGGNRLFTLKDFGSSWTRSKDLTHSINRDGLTMMGVLNKDIKLSRNDGDNISEISKTWTPVINGLPGDDASVRGLAEFPGHPNVLFAGTEPRARPSPRCCSAFHGSTRSRTSA
jgi:hypothetical protein